MDPLSIAAGTASLAAFVAKLGLTISECVEQIKSADTTLGTFLAELRSLEKSLRAVDAGLRRPEFRDALFKAVSPAESTAQMGRLEDVLQDCRLALQDLESLLDGLGTGNLSRGMLKGPALAWKLNSEAPRLARIQSLVKTYNSAIEIHLQLMNLLFSVDTVSVVRNMDQSLEEIKTDILRLRFQLQQVDGPRSVASQDPKAAASLQNYLSSSETFISSASEYLGSVAGTVRGDFSVADFPQSKVSAVHDWVARSAPLDDVAASSDDDDDDVRTMVSEFHAIAEEHFEQRNYESAQRFFNKFIEKAQSFNDWDADELCKAQVKLSRVLNFQDKHDEAERILKDIDDTRASPETRWTIKHARATTAIFRFDLPLAKACAEQAVRGRKKGDHLDDYYNSLNLLMNICQMLGEPEEAVVYQRRIPQDFKPFEAGPLTNAEQKAPSSTIERVDSNHSPTQATKAAEQRLNSPAFRNRISESHATPSSSQDLGAIVSPGTGPSSPHTDVSSSVVSSASLTLLGHAAPVTSVAFAADGKRIFSGSRDGTVRIWDSTRSLQLGLLQPNKKAWVLTVALSPNSNVIGIGSNDGRPRVWSLTSAKVIQTFGSSRLGYAVEAMAFSPDGNRFVYRSNNAGLISGYGMTVVDTTKYKTIWKYEDKHTIVKSMAFSPDGSQLLCSILLRNVGIWDVHSGGCRLTLPSQSYGSTAIAFAPAGYQVASASFKGQISTWDCIQGTELARMETSPKAISSVAYSRDGNTLICGSQDSAVYMLDTRSQAKIGILKGHTGGVHSVAVSPDGTKIVSGSEDCIVRIWDVRR